MAVLPRRRRRLPRSSLMESFATGGSTARAKKTAPHRRRRRAASPTRRHVANLDSPDLFLNRELTWLAFNRRVVSEAEDESNPLLERLKFLAITASNLDEFFMKRIGGLKQQAVAGVHQLTVDGRTPQQQIAECLHAGPRNRADAARSAAAVARTPEGPRHRDRRLRTAIRRRTADAARILSEEYLSARHAAGDGSRRIRFRSSRTSPSTCSSRSRAANDSEPLLARVKVPLGSGIPRFIRVGKGNRFVPLEERNGAQPRSVVPRHERGFVRILPRHAQCEHRARRGRGRRPARDDRVRAPGPPLRADRAPGGGHGDGSGASRDAGGGIGPGRARRRVRDRRHDRDARPDGAGRDRRSGPARSAASSDRPSAAPALAEHFPPPSRRGLDPAAPSLRVVLHFGRALPARGQRGSEGPRHQDDALPHLGRLRD